jgi:hypothetical protein
VDLHLIRKRKKIRKNNPRALKLLACWQIGVFTEPTQCHPFHCAVICQPDNRHVALEPICRGVLGPSSSGGAPRLRASSDSDTINQTMAGCARRLFYRGLVLTLALGDISLVFSQTPTKIGSVRDFSYTRSRFVAPPVSGVRNNDREMLVKIEAQLRTDKKLVKIHRLQGNVQLAERYEQEANALAREHMLPAPFPTLTNQDLSAAPTAAPTAKAQSIGDWVILGTLPTPIPTSMDDWAPAALPVFPTPRPVVRPTAAPTTSPTKFVKFVFYGCPPGKYLPPELQQRYHQKTQGQATKLWHHRQHCQSCPVGYYQSSMKISLPAPGRCTKCSPRTMNLPDSTITSDTTGTLYVPLSSLKSTASGQAYTPTWQHCDVSPRPLRCTGADTGNTKHAVVGECGPVCAGVCLDCPIGYFFEDGKAGGFTLPCTRCEGCTLEREGGETKGVGGSSSDSASRSRSSSGSTSRSRSSSGSTSRSSSISSGISGRIYNSLVRSGCGGVSAGVCAHCSSGRYKSICPYGIDRACSERVAKCLKCPCGKYAASLTAAGCSVCPVGYYSWAHLTRRTPSPIIPEALSARDDDGVAPAAPSEVMVCHVQGCRRCAHGTSTQREGSLGGGTCSKQYWHTHSR